MSLADQLKQLAKPQEEGGRSVAEEEFKQLKDLEEVEEALREIGITLEPKFDISLAARIGAVSAKK